MARLDLCIGDGAVCLNLHEQDDFAADVHAVSEFGIDGWDASDDRAMDVAGEGRARAKGERADANERTGGAKRASQLKPP